MGFKQRKNQLQNVINQGDTNKVSVLLPVYNGEKYIAEAVTSILNQTHINFEFIIINDGSIDNTLDILQKYALMDSRIRLVTRENQGLIASLNEGIDLSTGQWIARMDADDIAVHDRLEKQLIWADKTGADIVGSWVKFFGGLDRRVWRGCVTDDAIKVDMLFKCPLVHPSIFIRASTIKELKYDPKAFRAEDYDIWIRAAQTAAVFTNVPEVLLYYRKHSAQVSVVARAEQISRTEEMRSEYWTYVAEKLDLKVEPGSTKLFETSVPRNNTYYGELLKGFCERLVAELNEEARQVLRDNIFKLSLYKPAMESSTSALAAICAKPLTVTERLALRTAKVLPLELRRSLYPKFIMLLKTFSCKCKYAWPVQTKLKNRR